MTGPIASASPETAAHAPSARARRLVVGIDVADHRQRRGLRGRGADAHDDATDHQFDGGRRDRADDRSAAEDRHADQHETLAAEVVAERAEHQHQAGEGQGVTADDPLQLRDVGVQLRLHARSGPRSRPCCRGTSGRGSASSAAKLKWARRPRTMTSRTDVDSRAERSARGVWSVMLPFRLLTTHDAGRFIEPADHFNAVKSNARTNVWSHLQLHARHDTASFP